MENKIYIRKSKSVFFLLLSVLIFLACSIYLYFENEKLKDYYANHYSPIVSKEAKNLDINSDLVKKIYSSISTTAAEDLANHSFDDKLKLYLAYRNLKTKDIYDSNCNLFDNTSMQGFTCFDKDNYVPKAVKEDSIKLSLIILFGNNNVVHQNIQLGNGCLGGLQYIASRGEYVFGNCIRKNNSIIKADKELIEAISTNDTITLREKVRYYTYDNSNVPDFLRNGVFIHKFRFDENYNYIYVSRELSIK